QRYRDQDRDAGLRVGRPTDPTGLAGEPERGDQHDRPAEVEPQRRPGRAGAHERVHRKAGQHPREGEPDEAAPHRSRRQPPLAASGTPNTSSLRAIARSKPYRNGTRPKRNTSRPVMAAPVTWPQAKLNAPAPVAASVIATTALTTRPAEFARTSLPCSKWRM